MHRKTTEKYLVTTSVKRMHLTKKSLSNISVSDLQSGIAVSLTGSEFESLQHMAPHFTNYSDPMRSAGFRQVLTRRGKLKRTCSLHRRDKREPKIRGLIYGETMQTWRGQSYKDCKPKAWLMIGERKREGEGGGWSVSLVYFELQYVFPPPPSLTWKLSRKLVSELRWVFEPSVISTFWPVFVWRTRLSEILLTAKCCVWFDKFSINLLLERTFRPSNRKIAFTASGFVCLSF